MSKIKTPAIQETLLHERNSCQHYSIVAEPMTIINFSRENLDVEDKINQRRLKEQLKFEKERDRVDKDFKKKWENIKDSCLYDFAAEKERKRKERLNKNKKDFCRNFLEHFQILKYQMKMSPKHIPSTFLFPKEAFERANSTRFLRLVRQNNLRAVSKMLQVDIRLVYQFDEMKQTGLIMAAKRNHTIMVRLLLKNFSRVNFQDLPGRTALHFAVMNDNEDMVKLLLCFKADPNIEDNSGQSSTKLHESMGKKCNLKIGAHMKLSSDHLFRQKFLVDFIYKA